MTSEEQQKPEVDVGEEKKIVATAAEPPLTACQTLDEAHRCMALKQWEKAADLYAVALEVLSEQHSEDAPVLAPILHRYGRCLLEHAIATSGALGGGGGAAGASEAPLPKRKSEPAGASSSRPADPRFSFGGDAEEEEEDDENEAQEEDGEDADDLSTAFSVLDLARIIYQRLLKGESDDENPENVDAALETLDGPKWDYIKLKTELAEVLNDLGDVGLESENFSQASSDYESSLLIISPMLHPHSRRLADAYLRLGLALEFHPEPDLQATAYKFVQSAANALKTRLEALHRRQDLLTKGDEEEARAQAAAAKAREEKALAESESREGETYADSNRNRKGKSKRQERFAEKDDVAEMDEVKVEKELKDVEEMIGELKAKLEEYSNPSNGSTSLSGDASKASAGSVPIPESAKMALQQAINDAFLGASTNSLSGPSASDKPVTDISGMVKRKKRPVEGTKETEGKGSEGALGTLAAAETSTQSEGQAAGIVSSAPAGEPQSKKARVEDEKES